jgi:small subunit ribosomal protein S1
MRNKKERFVASLVDFHNDSDTQVNFSKMVEDAQDKSLQEGVVIRGVVTARDRHTVTVDVNLKSEGVVPLKEFERDRTKSIPEIGEQVDVFVEQMENRQGKVVLSREKAIREEAWEPIETAFAENLTVNGVIFGRIKGGLAVDLSGVVAFLPGSQIDTKPLPDVSHLFDIVQPFYILKMDRKMGNIVVSRRAVLESVRTEARDELLKNIRIGAVLEGAVKNITDYGAFIDLGSIDGLVHITDISWKRVNHPSEVLKVGERLKVVIINFDAESRRISLGIKQLDEKPWQEIQQEFPVGSIVKGKITNIVDYGVFVELKNGIDGLVHVSQLSWNSTKNDRGFKGAFTVDQDITCKVIGIDHDKYRVSLSVKQCTERPLQKFSESNPVGSIVKGQIKTIANFGMFVSLTEEITGLIHENDLSWTENTKAALSSFNKGDIIECKVLSIDVDRDRIGLGIKQIANDPYERFVAKYPVNSTVECKLMSFNEENAIVEAEGLQIFVSKSEINTKESSGSEITLQVREINQNERRVRLGKAPS